MVKLQRPSLDLFSSFWDFAEEMRLNHQPLWEGFLPMTGEPPEEFVNRLNRRETLPEPPLVPSTIYWGLIDQEVVGQIILRHQLAGNLAQIGGHIGYEVRPSYRRQGIATEMLRQILQTPKAREVGQLLLTCAPHNIGSNKTILANEGVLKQTVYVELVKEYRNHYWITAPGARSVCGAKNS